MSGWQIQLLGNTVVHSGDDLSITVSDPFARALLAYLALERQTPHRRRDLIALLWTDTPASKAADLLQNTLKILSNALNSARTRRATLDHTRFRVSLRLEDDLTVDVDRFHHALLVSERHPHTSLSTCASCYALLSHAASLYLGDFLEGLDLPGTLFANWLLDQRNELRDQAMHVFWGLAENDLVHNRLDSAIMYARKQLVLDPWHSPSHAQLMTALTKAERINDALTHYESLYPRYRAAFKRNPDPALTAQYDRLCSMGKPKPLVSEMETACPDPEEVAAQAFPAIPVINVGREVETAQLKAWLGDLAVRLVMLTGPGGIGKTHLALNAAQAVRGKFKDGVAYIPLLELGQCSTDDLNMMVQQRTGEANSDKAMLLILDNAEVVRESLDAWIMDFLGNSSDIKLLICTQFPLDVPGKRYALGYLPVPTHVDNSGAKSYASVRMFEAYAQAANPSFELSLSNVPAVVRICRAVEGLPLGIQLAAMWISQFSPTQLANALKHDLDSIISPNDSLPERHRNLRSLFYRTLTLLPERERNTLLQCAIFDSDFDSDAAQQVVVGNNILVDIDTLIQYGLVLRIPEERLTLAPTIRIYARELLNDPDLIDNPKIEDPAITQTAQRHSAYFRALLHDHMERWRKGAVNLQVIEHELENIRTAWHWLERHASEPFLLSQLESWLTYLQFSGDTMRGIEVCDKLAWYLKYNLPSPESDREFANARQRIIARLGIAHVSFLISAGRYTEVDEILARTVQQVTETGDDQLRTQLSLTWGELFTLRGDYAEAQEHLSQVWHKALALSSAELTASNLLALGRVSLLQNNEEMAQTYYEQVLELSHTIRLRWIECVAQNAMGTWHLYQGDYGQAQEYINKAWLLIQELGIPWLMPAVQLQQGMLAQRVGKLDDARGWYEHALSLSREHHHRRAEIRILTALAGLFYDRHENEAAMQTAQQAIEPAHIAGLRAEEANAMLIAARILEADHQIDYAQEAYQRVLPIYESLGKTDEIPVVQAGLARCEELRGYHDRAVRLAERIVHRLRNKGRLLAIHEPMHIYCTCYDILVPDNPPRAVTVLRLAQEELQKQAKSIRDPHTRASFLNKVAANRDIANRMQLYDRRR